MNTRHDSGFVSALVICLVLPSMAGLWWRYFVEPSTQAASEQRASYTVIKAKLEPGAPAIPILQERSKHVRVAVPRNAPQTYRIVSQQSQQDGDTYSELFESGSTESYTDQ